jgi:hypothetical protein
MGNTCHPCNAASPFALPLFGILCPTAHASLQAQPQHLSAMPPTRTPKTQKAKGKRRHCTWWCHGDENPPFRPNVSKRRKATLNTPRCHEKVPRTQGTHQAEPSPRHVLKQLKDASQPQHPDRWGSICPRHTGVIPAHPEALCRPSPCVEVPGSSQHAMCCLAGQHCRGLVGKAATIGQAGWVIPLGVPSSLQRQHPLPVGSRVVEAAMSKPLLCGLLVCTGWIRRSSTDSKGHGDKQKPPKGL